MVGVGLLLADACDGPFELDIESVTLVRGEPDEEELGDPDDD